MALLGRPGRGRGRLSGVAAEGDVSARRQLVVGGRGRAGFQSIISSRPMSRFAPAFRVSVRARIRARQSGIPVKRVRANHATISCPSCPHPTRVDEVSKVRAMAAEEKVRARLIGNAPSLGQSRVVAQAIAIPEASTGPTFTHLTSILAKLSGIRFTHLPVGATA